MAVTKLREIEGTLMLPISRDMLQQLSLTSESPVDVSVHGRRIVMQAPENTTPDYTLDQLLDMCDPNAPRSEEDALWLNSPPVGRELI
jgi:antitoxin ChpS